MVQDALHALDEKAKTSGAYGVSTERQLDTSRPHLAPPPGAELATVHVRCVGCATHSAVWSGRRAVPNQVLEPINNISQRVKQCSNPSFRVVEFLGE